MKTNSIILSGKQASGKTFIAETMASIIDSKRLLRIDSCDNTVVSTARQINKTNFDLIIFDNCYDKRHIKFIDKWLKRYFVNNDINVKTLLYLTLDTSFKKLENFKIIECTYEYKKK